MASSSNSSMMSTIDSLKEKMSDEVYLALCEKMKELHTEHQQVVEPTRIPVRIWFMIVQTSYVDPDEPTRYDVCGELYEVVPVQRIVMMTRVEMEIMKEKLDRVPGTTVDYSFDDIFNHYLYNPPMVSRADCLHPHNARVYRVEEI